MVESGILWVDILNSHFSALEENDLYDGWLCADNNDYGRALKVLKRYIRRFPIACIKAPGGVHHIKPGHAEHFLTFFVENFRRRGDPPSTEVPEQRSRRLLSSDIPLDESFYLDLDIDYDKLSVREQQKFEELKDELHENLYGHIERFNETNHGFVSRDDELLLEFKQALVRFYDDIVDARVLAKGRRYRSYIQPPRY